eukprot:CAMPEP_0177650254 /NCGR_PEP_ID=MMETSP0447-20121125/11841_1 /TAXON_ID=0 /ORGANISM="Stygamoeba regulata, Strain BSH-02190019" /LENGTH=218 /DNA_ID=CAMNT_0019153105 /DNA_START=147 /DNA_END=803 /DNA_ORIENTATION=+
MSPVFSVLLALLVAAAAVSVDENSPAALQQENRVLRAQLSAALARLDALEATVTLTQAVNALAALFNGLHPHHDTLDAIMENFLNDAVYTSKGFLPPLTVQGRDKIRATLEGFAPHMNVVRHSYHHVVVGRPTQLSPGCIAAPVEWAGRNFNIVAPTNQTVWLFGDYTSAWVRCCDQGGDVAAARPAALPADCIWRMSRLEMDILYASSYDEKPLPHP